MKTVTLGKTGITVPQNAFGALPVQRDTKETAVMLLRKAYEGGMRFFDTARAYSDSEEKLGEAFSGWVDRDKIYIATKTHALTPDEFWADLNKSLKMLKTDYIDLYQLHQCDQCYKPGDGTGLYECLQEAKAKGLVRHIGLTTHKLEVAFEVAGSDLYETLQFPFSYLASDKDIELVNLCKQNNIGFIGMKGLAGGLLTNSKACMAFISQFEVLPIWGVQRENELDEWLSYMNETPVMDAQMTAFIEKEKSDLAGNFCRGCGYCMPCTVGIKINNCNRTSLMLRRAPSQNWLSPQWQAEMNKIDDCVECGLCMTKCPYELNIPKLLKENLADYRKVLAGEISVN